VPPLEMACGRVLLVRLVPRRRQPPSVAPQWVGRQQPLLVGPPQPLLVAAVDWRLHPQLLTCKLKDRHLVEATGAVRLWLDRLPQVPREHQQLHFTQRQQLGVLMQVVWLWVEALQDQDQL